MGIDAVFDELSDEYTQKITRWVPYYKTLISAPATMLPDDFSPHQILDLGCGNGNASFLLLKKYPSATFHLTDASAEMIEACRKRFEDVKGITYSRTFFQDLDIPADHFDLIIATLSLHHLNPKEKEQMVQKIYQGLRPGGYFSYSDLFIDKTNEPTHSDHLKKWKAYAFDRATTDDEWQWIMDHYDKYDFPEGWETQQRYLRKAGFSMIEKTWSTFGWTNLTARK